MKCRANSNRNVGNLKVIEFFMNATAYVLFEHGYEKEKVLKILEQCEDVADSMVGDYIKFSDIRKVLKEEYDFEIIFH
jgi:hypothetical protein